MSRYAEQTKVSPERSKAEIESILVRYGASSFASAWSNNTAAIMFEMEGRRIKFTLPLPDRKSDEFTLVRQGGYIETSKSVGDSRYNQAVRRRWRALALAIKAKLESVKSGITTFEQEFLAHIVLPGGETVGQWMGPQIANAYKSGKIPPLLGSGASIHFIDVKE